MSIAQSTTKPLSFAEEFAKIRHERHETQQETADALGVTSACVSAWERNESRPRWKVMRLACLRLNDADAASLMKAYTAK